MLPRPAVRVLLAYLLLWRAVPARASSWVEWDRATDRVVSAPRDQGAAAPRARQLSNGEILLAYHHGEPLGNCGSRVTLRRSRDGGATWFQTREVEGPEPPTCWGFSNPDFIELGHGRLILVSAARGRADPAAGNPFFSECQRSGLRVRFSENYGATWGPPRLIAAGRGRVWEPSVVRLPGGELQIFYAIEPAALPTDGSTQRIECIRSADDGKTWGAPVLVSEEAGCRNGMPAALAMSNGHVICGQEVVGLDASPWIVDTLRGRTQGYHLAQDRYDFGAAPFLARAADGGTLLAFHSQCLQSAAFKALPGAWLFSQVYVQRGDAAGGHFGAASCPWPPPAERTGMFFPSVLALDGGRLAALASFITVGPDRRVSTVVRWVQGQMTNAAPE